MKSIIKNSLTDIPSLFRDDLFFSNLLTKEQAPSVNIKQNDTSFELEVVAPGIKKEEFKLEVDNGIMTISGEAEKTTEKDTKKYYRKEYSFESFSRQFILPENVDADKIEANYADGVLRVNLPKIAEQKTDNKKTIKID
jgi:HSP20 family protein